VGVAMGTSGVVRALLLCLNRCKITLPPSRSLALLLVLLLVFFWPPPMRAAARTSTRPEDKSDGTNTVQEGTKPTE